MDCEAISRDELIEKYLNHRLDPVAEDEFELHVFGCSQCARLLEVFQTVHADLTQREHEIRTQTASKHFLIRWEVAVFASLLLIAGVAGILRIQNTKKLSAKVPAGPQIATDLSPAAAPALPKSDASGQPPSSSQPLPKPQSNRAPTRTAIPKSGKNEMAAESPTAQAEEQPPLAPTLPVGEQIPAVRDKDEHAAINPGVNSSEARNQGRMTVAQGVELYRLGMVQAPPYTFSGVAAGGELPGTGKSDSYSSRGGPSDSGRVLFQNGMNAYIEGHYNEAADFLVNALRNEPKAPDINFYFGVCKLLAGRPEESMAPLTTAVAAGNSPFLQSSHYYLAKAYIRSIKLEEAESELRAAIAISGRLTADSKALLIRVQALHRQLGNQ